MERRRRFRLGVLLAVFALLASAPLRAGEVDSLSISDDYLELPRDTIILRKVPNPPRPRGKLKTASQLGQTLTKELVDAIRRELPASDVQTVDASTTPSAGLVVVCKYLKVVPGSRAKRFWLGFGAGKSTVALTGEIQDAATGRTVARFKHARLSWCCGFGGNDHEVHTNIEKAAEDIAALVAGRLDREQKTDALPRQ